MKRSWYPLTSAINALLLAEGLAMLGYAPQVLAAACGKGAWSLLFRFLRFLSFVGLLLGATNASAALCTSAAGARNWNAVGTWSCGHVPLNNDDVVVANNSVVTVNMAGAVAGSLTIASGANTSTLQFGGAVTSLTVTNAGGLTGDVTINAPTSNGVFKQITVGARSLTVTGNVTINGGTAGGTAATRTSQLTVTSGTVTIGTVGTPKTLSINAGTATTNIAQVVLTPAAGVGTITVNGNVTLTGGATAATQDALLNVNGASNVGNGLIITGNLNVNSTIAGSSSVTMTGAAGGRISVTGAVNNEDTLTVGAGIVSVGTTLTTSDPAIVSVTSVTTGTLAITGNAVVDSGAIGASSMTVTSGVITVGGTLGVTAAAAGANTTGDATVSVTTGRITVTGDTTVTGGNNNNGQDALLTVGASAVGNGVTIGGALNIVSSVAGSSTVSITNAAGRITVTGAVNNEDTLTVGAGIVSVGTTLTTSDPAIVSVTSVTTGTLAIAGNAVVDSGAIGASSMTVTTGVITVGGTLDVTAATTGVSATGDATVSVTTGRITVTGNATVTGGVAAGQVATLTVTGAGAVGQGVNIGGALNIVSTVAATAVVSTTNATSRITVNGAGGVNNGGTLSVGVGIVNVTNAAATLTTRNDTVPATTSVTSGTLTIVGNLAVTAAAATADTGDATVSVTTGRIDVTGNATVTGGSNANRDALLTVTGAPAAAGNGINIGGALNIVSTVAGSATVSTTVANARIAVNGAGGVSNEDTLSVGPGSFSVTNAAATLTTSDPAIVSVTSVTSGTLAIAGSAVVDSGAVGASSMTVTTGVITVGGTLGVTAATTGVSATGDATVSVTTGRISVTGNTTVTGGNNNNGQDALLTVGGAPAVAGNGINIGGNLNVNATVATSSTVSITAVGGVINVAGDVNNQDTIAVGTGVFSATGGAATFTTTNTSGLAATTSVTSGTLAISGNVVVDSGTNGLKTMSVTTGIITVGGNLSVTAAAATADTGDATVSVTTGRITVTGNATVTGGSNANRDALLTVSAGGAVGQGINIGGTLDIVSTAAGSATVSTTNATGRITVSGAGGVNNGDTLAVGVGIVSLTNLTNSNATVVATTTISTGTLGITGAVNNAAGETLVCSAACNISVGTSFTSNGTFTPSSGTVTLNGAAAQTISGTSPIPFFNLSVTNAANPNITLATNVTVAGTLSGIVTLTNTCPTDYTLTSTIPAQVLHSCPPTAANFNACSTTDACPTSTARLHTRIANGNFAIFFAALKVDGTVETTFSGSAAVSLVGRIASGGPIGADNCPTGAVDLTQALGTLAFTAGKRTQTGVNVANAYRDVRVKFVCDATNCPPSGVTACSSDNFSVRPDNLAVSATISSPLKAGDATVGDTFTLSALASGNATTTATYNGTPQVDAALVAAASSGPNIAGILDGTFGAAIAGTASGTFGYSEAGYFNIAAQGAYDVAFVTAADVAGTDCTNDFNNTYVAATPSSTVGCSFGNLTASANIGRFTPDKFVSLSDGVPVPPVPSVTPFCGSGATGFTYAGQAALRLKVTLEAQNKAGIRTQNYDDTYANGKGLVEFLAENGDDDVNLGGRLDHAGGPWTAGRFAVGTTTTGTFSRNNSTPDGPFDSLEIGVRVTRASTADGDDDGIKVSPEDMAVAGRNGLKLPGTTRVRYGILKLDNAYGTELLNLRVPMRTLYLATAPGQFVVNTLDSCTTLAAANVAFGNFKGSLASLTINGINQISAGQGSIVLTKPSLVGSADMAVNLTNTVNDVSCNTTHPATTGANRAWLQGKWCGSNYDKDPNARVRFGVSKAPYIYLRERY